MTKADTWIGLVLVGVAIAALTEAWTFASVPGLKFGAWTFPVFVSVALSLAGATLFLLSVLSPNTEVSAPMDRRAIIGWCLVASAPVAYILAAETFGFLLTCAALILVLSLWFWGGIARCSALAVNTAITLEIVFAKGFAVPLPHDLISVTQVL